MYSLVRSLKKIDKKPPFSILKDLQTHPNSLREIMRIMNLSEPKINELQRRKVKEFTEENAQGLTYAHDNIWFLSSELNIFKYSIEGDNLYKPTDINHLQKVPLSQLISSIGLEKDDWDHIGDIDYYEGLLFLPVRHRSHKPPHLLIALSDELKVVGYSKLFKSSDSWCAINPWNRLLYVLPDKGNGFLNVFDVSAYYKIYPNSNEWGKSLRIELLESKRFRFYEKNGRIATTGGFQGLAFSQNGWMYAPLAKLYYDGVFGKRWDNYLRIYSTLTGTFVDSVEYDFDGVGDEIEGLSIHPSGVMYIAVADNDASDDEFEIHAFEYPDIFHPI